MASPTASLYSRLLNRQDTSAHIVLGWVCFALFAVVYSLRQHMMIGLSNDHLVLMDEVRRLLAGAIPYIDFTDVSPPLIHLLYMPPYALSQATGWPLYGVLYGMVYALTALSLIASEAVLHHSRASVPARWMVVSTLAVMLLFASFIHQVFADREHLMMVLAAPWFVMFSPLVKRERVPQRWRIAVAAMAAVGFAIKPYFYVFYAATIAFSAFSMPLKQVMRRVEHAVVLGFALAYGVVIVIFFPQYLFTMLPVGLMTYGAIAWSLQDKFNVVGNVFLGEFGLPGLAATLVLAAVTRKKPDRDIAYILVLMLAAVLCYLLNYGWYYTQYPFIAFALALAVAITEKWLAACRKVKNLRHKSMGRLLVLIAAACGLSYAFIDPTIETAERDVRQQRISGHSVTTQEMHPGVTAQVYGHLETHPRFMFFSLDMWSINLMMEGTPRENVGRFDIMWPLPGILKLRNYPAERERYYWLAEWFIDSVVSDIEDHKPDMIINDISPVKRVLPKDYNMFDLLETNSRFALAMQQYKLEDTLRYCDTFLQSRCAYEIYYRK